MPANRNQIALVLRRYGIDSAAADACADAFMVPTGQKTPEQQDVLLLVGRFIAANVTDPAIENAISRELQAAMGLD